MLSWEELKVTCGGCTRCGLCETRHNVVFGVGNEKADILFVGEGPAGKLLDDMLSIIDLSRQESCYI